MGERHLVAPEAATERREMCVVVRMVQDRRALASDGVRVVADMWTRKMAAKKWRAVRTAKDASGPTWHRVAVL